MERIILQEFAFTSEADERLERIQRAQITDRQKLLPVRCGMDKPSVSFWQAIQEEDASNMHCSLLKGLVQNSQ